MKLRTLEKTSEDSRAMKESFKLAMKEIEAVLGKKRSITDLTKLAANTVSNYAKIRSTEVHDKALEVMLLRRGMKKPQPAVTDRQAASVIQ